MPMRLCRHVESIKRPVILGALLAFAVPSSASAATAFFEPDTYQGGYVRDMRVVDFDDDGHDDIVTVNSGGLSIWLGDGSGAFEIVDHPISTTFSPQAVEIEDVDVDGALDALVVVPADGALLLRGDGEGGVEDGVAIDANATDVFAIGDFGGSGAVDVAMSRSLGSIALLIQQSDGSFAQNGQLSMLSTPSKLVASDLDGDGDDDLAAVAGERVFTFLHTGDGFDPYVMHTVESGASDMEVADLNSDGDLDIATARYGASGGLSVLTATAPGVWGPATTHQVGVSANEIEIRDLDGDSDEDVVLTPSAENRLRLLIQGNDGGFESIEVETFYGYGQGHLGTGDFDEDGELDLVVATFGRAVQVAFGDALSVTPSWIDFGLLAPAAMATESFTVRNTGRSALNPGDIGIVGDSSHFSIVSNGCAGQTLVRRAACEVGVRYVAPFATDQFWAAAVIPGSGATGPRFVEMDGASWLPGALTPDPREIDFGYIQPRMTSPPRAVQIVNGGGAPISVGSVTTSESFSVASDGCTDVVLDVDEACTIAVTFRPRATALAVGSLTVASTDGSASALTTLRGTATRPRSILPPRSPVPRPPGTEPTVEFALAMLTDAVPKLVRGGPTRLLRLPRFLAPSAGRLSLTLFGWDRSRRVRIGGGSLKLAGPKATRLRFRLNRKGVALLRRPQRTRIKAIAKFVPREGAASRQGPEYLVKPPVGRRKRG
jgi:hypothetical protein